MNLDSSSAATRRATRNGGRSSFAQSIQTPAELLTIHVGNRVVSGWRNNSLVRPGWRTGLLLWGIVLCSGGWVNPAFAQTNASAPAYAPAPAPALQQWVMQTGDNENAPFIIIDKRQARLWLFTAAGQPLGDTPVLLGLAHGDESVPGIGERAMKDIQTHERTTPAGRFIAEVGRNADGEDIFWIDYDAAVSMHRVRASNPAERRLQRLATPTPTDNRISYGCINVPTQFYDQRIHPIFSSQGGIVYVLPETLPSLAMFKAR